MKILLHLLSLCLFINIAVAAPPPSGNAQVPGETQATYQDIKQTLGIVPTFLKDFPQDSIVGAWEDMKNVQLNLRTSLSGKTKELIGLAVAAQIPCRYCTYFHTQAAKLNNATKEEMMEAVAVAANERRWQALLSGWDVGMNQYRADVDKIIEFSQGEKTRQAEEARQDESERPITVDQKTYNDIKATYGFVPSYMMNYPVWGVSGLWKEVKAIEHNPDSKLTAKDKALIGLAVASQIPSPHRIYFQTAFAKAQGATQDEINEALAMSGLTRHWSTVLNGEGINGKTFKQETDQIMKFVKAKAAKAVSKI